MLVWVKRRKKQKCKIPKLQKLLKGTAFTELTEFTEMGKGRKHPEAAVRMNFLHQAAACVLKSTGNKVRL